ncbi:exosome complex protein Rrp42 [Candidatus Woesearchaeota archaeon]|nr:exosome complex protein Rrp42 [Candidatus Woesearchaeota archaeon]
MSNGIVTSHIINLIDKDSRLDGRKLDQFRDIKIEYGVSAKSAEGSALVKIGKTEVVAGIKMEVGEPYPDRLDEGTIIANVELLPLSSGEFESGPPTIKSIELARSVVDRGLRESKAIDFKKLTIKKGEKVWTILIDAYSINDDGNLADAIGLATLAAIKDAKFPKYDEKEEKIDYKEKTKKGIELKELPIPVTVLKIKNKFILDPTLDEENAMGARLTVTTVEDGRICALQKGGISPLTPEDTEKIIELATKKGKELRKLFK